MKAGTRDALLLEILEVSGCSYLSDLPSATFSDKVKKYIRLIPTDKYSVKIWNETASYLLKCRLCLKDVEEVKRKIELNK